MRTTLTNEHDRANSHDDDRHHDNVADVNGIVDLEYSETNNGRG